MSDKSTTDWLRAYTVLARSGYVTEPLAAQERAWESEYLGNPGAARQIQRTPGYQAYAQALRRLLAFPLTVYRILPAITFEQWQAGAAMGFGPATTSLQIARAFRQIFPCQDQALLLLEIRVLDPEAVVMRGRIRGYEVVLDFTRISPAHVRVIDT